MKLILGSGSPRRLELLAQIGVIPDAVSPPDINEDVAKVELPRDYVKRIAAEKSAAVIAGPNDIVLVADTTVALGRRIMGKPVDSAEARAFLALLSGRRHKVITAVVVKRGDLTWARDADDGDDEALILARNRQLYCQRRLARQGGRLCHSRPRQCIYSMD